MWDKIISTKEFNNVYFKVEEFPFDTSLTYLIFVTDPTDISV